MGRNKTIRLRIIGTSDVHGSFFPYDFIKRQPKKGSLARVMSYVEKLRTDYGDRLLLLDAGDILQGQPICFRSNYMRTDHPNIAALVTNYMGYEALVPGNHDIETGHEVYDKWIHECKHAVLGANITETKTGKPYLPPYIIIERDGIRIAVIGMLTPAIPHWLNQRLWDGLQVEEMVASARYWVKKVKGEESPDLIIGLFHSGREGGIATLSYKENATLEVARSVAGFDLILFGHDHIRCEENVISQQGQRVLCLNPGSDAHYVADVEIELAIQERSREGEAGRKIVSKHISGHLIDIDSLPPHPSFMTSFQEEIEGGKEYVETKIGSLSHAIQAMDGLFGCSDFIDLIHDVQLQYTGADVSFNAPPSLKARLSRGDIRVGDLFCLYPYENQICVLKMTGKEIRSYLEMSYSLWVNTMLSANDHLLLFRETKSLRGTANSLKNFIYNFDSAVGIEYTVDVTKPDGKKINIVGFTDGRPFSDDAWYKVVMNSYRANGGGELLTKGAGIQQEALQERVLLESPEDLRSCLIKEIERQGMLRPHAHQNWRFVPDSWVKPAIERDKAYLSSNY